jgi:flagellin
MSRINTNIPSLIAQRNLANSNDGLSLRLERLSTGLRINRGADGPAALIISERLRAEIRGVDQAIENAERAANVLATAEAAMSEMSNLLLSIKSLVVETANEAGLSQEEVRANQLQLDSAVDAITRISNTTSFAGLKLLNGSLDYVTSGVPASAIASVQIQAANFGQGPFVPVSVSVVTSAQQAELTLSTGSTTIPSSLTLEVAGNLGVSTFDFVSGASLSAIVNAVNTFSEATGVQATIVSGAAAGLSAIRFDSTEYGDDAFVSVQPVPGSAPAFFQTFNAAGNPTSRDIGQDVVALVNGALAVGQGTDVIFNSPTLKLSMKLDPTYAQTPTGSLRQFAITDGGTTYQLGPVVSFAQQVGFGIQGMGASQLGDAVVGFLESITTGGANSLLAGGTPQASLIVDEAIRQVTVARGRLGAFEANTLNSTARSLGIALENLSASESRIRDTDFAEETSNLTRDQILVNVGSSMLGIANSSAANVLALLQ